MADTLIFDPASEFEIIETLDFEEEVQRPEELRFFTLDEQLLDYFDKVLPKKKNITNFEYDQISKEVDRIRQLYNKVITITDSNYEIDMGRKSVNVPWILPIYEPFQYSPYSFEANWLPLYERGSRTQPNFYPRMLAALPRPYKTTSVGGVPLEKFTVAVDEDGKHTIHAQDLYQRTKRALHEDGTFDIVKVPISNTEDDIRLRGYYLKDRGVDIPNALMNHDFFESSKESKLITNEKLVDIFPHIDAVIQHGVPLTTDPYNEGLKYLKIYDVKLDQIPWNLWKERFPPVDLITNPAPVESIKFSDSHETTQPSKSIQDTYVKKWSHGIDPRLWLMEQEDAGRLVIKMLLSKAGDNGRTPPETPGERPVPSFPTSTPEECYVDGDFDAFLNAGVYRNPGVCVPASYISQEREFFKIDGKKGWVDTTANDILIEEQKLLKLFQSKQLKESETKYEKYSARPDSDLRKQVIAILNDVHRTPKDKMDAIQKIVREIIPQNEVFLDSTNAFIVCNHTLAELGGDLEKDKDVYYALWTSIDDGFRACKFCGEHVNTDVFTAQDDFDENGNVIISHEKLPESFFPGSSYVASFTTSLKELQKIFNLNNTGEVIFYLILSTLQVLPTESQTLPFLENIRELSSVVRSKSKIGRLDKDRIEGIIGLANCIVLIQSHNPLLVPRRSFGSKVIKLNGFPRDTPDSNNSPVLDTIISILKNTIESLGFRLQGASSSLLRAIVKNPKSVREESIRYIEQSSKKFNTMLLAAKEKYVDEDIKVEGVQAVQVKKQVLAIGERLGKEETISECNIPRPKSIISAKLKPILMQEKVKLWEKIKPATQSVYLDSIVDVPISVTFTKEQVQSKIKLGIPKGFELPGNVKTFLQSDTDFTAFSSFLSRMLDILSVNDFSIESLKKYRTALVYLDKDINKSLLRDAALGLIFELLHEIWSLNNRNEFVKALKDAMNKDLVMNMILITKEQAQKQDNELKATEREVFKNRMRQLNDTEREITKMLLDIGIASYIITNEDRELFAKQYNYQDPEEEYKKEEEENDPERPEGGYNSVFDTVDNGDNPVTDDGKELPYDIGDYGDRVERLKTEYETTYIDNYEEDGI